MESNQSVSMLCFSATTDELAAVLDDAACSFMDADGRFHLARPVVVSGSRPDVGEFCASVLSSAIDRRDVARIDLGAGRDPVEADVLADPIKLLHWIISQAAAVDFHPTVNAYIFSSDPDDILPFLPFHPSIGKGGRGIAELVAVRLPIAEARVAAARPGVIQLDGYELSLPASVK
jgi:hypothetical protein